MRYLLLATIRKSSVFLLVFCNVQLTSRLTAIAFEEPSSSQSVFSAFPDKENLSSESICPAKLGSTIEAVINRPQFRRARWGILIEPLSPNAIAHRLSVKQDNALYRREAEHYFIPASNVKLLTTAAALLQIGSDFRIRTSIYSAGAGSLRVVGRGDPSLTDAQLRELAQQLKRQGIHDVQELIVEDGYFQGDAINLTWEWEDVQSDYGTAVNSLILNQNAAELTLIPQQVGQPLRLRWTDAIASRQWQIENHSVTAQATAPSTVEVTGVLGQPLLQIKGQLAIDAEPESFYLAILDPAKYFLEHFQRVLLEEGIRVASAVVSKTSTTGEQELAAIESAPLSVLLVETNQQSNNLYAEVLLRTLQISSDTQANKDSVEIGLNEVTEALTTLGVNPESYVLVDGSGLSRRNLVSPDAIVQTLKLMAQSPQASVYRESLPVAGESGTLRRRFLSTAAQGNVQAKTGTLTGVSALSGYIDVPGYQPLVFSIMVNQSDQSVASLREAIDEIVLLLTRLRSC
jgi:D-alanyl-D-alanine carboxypeptidase/D-alanyl-D-alanine-endopeptidase (penicillin-binding protein 4)